MKPITALKHIILAISIILFVVGLYLYQQRRIEIQKSITVQGTVVGSFESVSSELNVYYHPIVRFTAKGKVFQITSSSNGFRPLYQPGANVEILYNPNFPEKGEIKQVVSSVGTSGICIFYSIITFSIFLFFHITQKKAENIYHNGNRIITQYDNVTYSYNIKRMKLYQIHSTYKDPKTNEIRVFKSPKLLVDPTDFITTKSINVIMHPTNAKKYLMDLSFLGKNYI